MRKMLASLLVGLAALLAACGGPAAARQDIAPQSSVTAGS